MPNCTIITSGFYRRCVYRLQVKRDESHSPTSAVRFRVSALSTPFFGPDSKPLTTSVIHCCSTSVQALLPPLSSLVPLDLKVDGRANWVWLKQDVLNLFSPSVSGLQRWMALIAAMVRYIFEVFSLLRWELACAIYVYIKAILIPLAGFEIRKVNCLKREQRHMQWLFDVACCRCFFLFWKKKSLSL